MTTVAASLFRRLSPVYGIFAALLIATVVLVGALVAGYGALTESAWNLGAASTSKWFVASIAIMLGPVFLRRYVAFGVTRRQFLGGGLLFGLGSAGAFALLSLAGFGVERLVYGAAGLMPGLTETLPVHSAGTAIAVLVRAFLIYLAHFCSGWLIGAGFHRFGPFGGLLLIAPSLLPALGSELAFGTEWSPIGTATVAGVQLPFPVSALLTTVLVVAGFATVYAFGRAVAISGKIS
ncbi:hypothetical protein J2S43_005715 [Catenuloplanes nepalensis]|uniref:ABC transporter permease n=1 Tax=Catenuloplanes nepalensis TaxID=587533 RepID=A0ABT9N0I6_9ACTN|nr:hypothetical protein [Catenuloplanes nepalensis]MDP9797203.1 hypothetical protein [Catenuloplanes nepalensis]